MKTCCMCKGEKPLSDFYSHRVSGEPHDRCKECCSIRSAKYREHNREKMRAKKREWDIANTDKKKARDARYRANNAQYIADALRAYRQTNKALFAHHAKLYKTDKLRACPSWLTDDDLFMIFEAYDLAQRRAVVCGGVWHVDHVVPLRGKAVSGLHVPWNLQVIPKANNLRKSNHHA